MNIKTKLVASILMAGSVSMAQATTYDVMGMFNEPMVPGTAGDTKFIGQIDLMWDGSTYAVNSFSGTMNESMQGPWMDVSADPSFKYIDGNPLAGGSTATGGSYPYMITLDKNIQVSDDGTTFMATVFKNDSSNVYMGGGYSNVPAGMDTYRKYGLDPADTDPAGMENAFFTLAFNHDSMGNITGMDVNGMGYGDCTIGSMMMMGNCMAGEPTGSSMMAGTPLSLEMTPVTAVPVPAAVWLFGSAMFGLLGVNRRKNAEMA